MPIYEFECSSCGTRFDRLQKLSDSDPTACPECGMNSISRRLTAPAFRLAGSGWYETDFKKDGDKKRNLVDKGEPATAESKPAEVKPEKSASGEKKADAPKPKETKVGAESKTPLKAVAAEKKQ
jgi:putative FmdB family regulatory protein